MLCVLLSPSSCPHCRCPILAPIFPHKFAGFVQVVDDIVWTQPSLASNVSRFLSENSHLVPTNANLDFVWNGAAGVETAMLGQAESNEWTRNCMYVSIFIAILTVICLS